MTYNFAGDWLNVADIKYLHTDKSDNPNYPFRLTVNFKSGGAVSTSYKGQRARDAEAARIAQRMEACFEAMHPEPTPEWKIKQIAAGEVEKVRRDIRTLKKMIADLEAL